MFTAINLFEWQKDAVTSWKNNNYRGTLHIFTGGGKSLMALQCYFEAKELDTNLQLVLIVPTTALVEQWKQTILKHTNINEADIGMLGGGHRNSLDSHPILITTLQSAYKSLPEKSKSSRNPIMLIVDECHKAGSSKYSSVLNIEAKYRLGLSATPDRGEEDNLGNNIDYDNQLVGQKLGPIVYTFSLEQARSIGWLPEFKIFHHGVELNSEELFSYRNMTEDITDALETLQAHNINPNHAQKHLKKPAPIGPAAKTYTTMVKQRKHLLYKSHERNRIAKHLIIETLQKNKDSKIIIFHERQDLCKDIYDYLRASLPEEMSDKIGMEHSGIKPASKRMMEVQKYLTGTYNVLVSVKTLVEGIDSDTDTGIVVASSSSVRQRVQTFGRILRRRFDDTEKQAKVHLIYVQNTVDERIYEKLDWRTLTGADNNSYLSWGLDQEKSIERENPPRQPLLLEEDAFLQLERNGKEITYPQVWRGEIPNQRFSIDTQGLIQNSDGIVITNPQGVPEELTLFQNKPGGKVYITPKQHLVIAFSNKTPHVIGKIQNGFTAAVAEDVHHPRQYQLGDEYFGPNDKKFGEWKNIGKGIRYGKRDFAVENSTNPDHQQNYKRLRERANEINPNGLKFFINSHFDAYYFNTDGKRYYLCTIQGGLDVPTNSIFKS